MKSQHEQSRDMPLNGTVRRVVGGRGREVAATLVRSSHLNGGQLRNDVGTVKEKEKEKEGDIGGSVRKREWCCRSRVVVAGFRSRWNV